MIYKYGQIRNYKAHHSWVTDLTITIPLIWYRVVTIRRHENSWPAEMTEKVTRSLEDGWPSNEMST